MIMIGIYFLYLRYKQKIKKIFLYKKKLKIYIILLININGSLFRTYCFISF